MVDTVRSLGELLNTLFASGQPPRSITEQDVRDAIVSISLETANLSDLPQATTDLTLGRLWIDSAKALRVVVSVAPPPTVLLTMPGAGSLFADPQFLGRQFANAKLTAASSLTASTVVRAAGSSRVNAASVLYAFPGAGSFDGAAFSSAFSRGLAAGPTLLSSSATLAGAATIKADPLRASSSTWSTTNKSTLITLSGAGSFNSGAFSTAFARSVGVNTVATKTASAGIYGGLTSSVFKSSGKWYWEFVIGLKAGDTGVGLANPSWPVDNADPTLGSYLGVSTNSMGLYSGGSTGYVNDGTGGPTIGPMPNVVAGGNVGIAFDADNWKWWARQDGGAWNAGQAGTQNPATNQGGIPLGASYRVGGMAPAITLQNINDAVTGRFSSGWSFSAPLGFSAP